MNCTGKPASRTNKLWITDDSAFNKPHVIVDYVPKYYPMLGTITGLGGGGDLVMEVASVFENRNMEVSTISYKPSCSFAEIVTP